MTNIIESSRDYTKQDIFRMTHNSESLKNIPEGEVLTVVEELASAAECLEIGPQAVGPAHGDLDGLIVVQWLIARQDVFSELLDPHAETIERAQIGRHFLEDRRGIGRDRGWCVDLGVRRVR